MKLKFKHQKFQADAAKAVVDVFAGQPYLTANYLIDRGDEKWVQLLMTHILPVGAISQSCRS